jgi:hypothetical protein
MVLSVYKCVLKQNWTPTDADLNESVHFELADII